MTHKFAFLDTDFFLHYVQPQDADWCKFLGSDRVTLLVSSMVTDQLDKHKDQHPVRGLRKRAKSALSRINEFFKNDMTAQLRDGVIVEFRAKSPLVDYASLGLDRESQDDRILADILSFAQENPAADLILITTDMGFQIKARSHAVRVVEPPQDWRLPVLSEEAVRHISFTYIIHADNLVATPSGNLSIRIQPGGTDRSWIRSLKMP